MTINLKWLIGGAIAAAIVVLLLVGNANATNVPVVEKCDEQTEYSKSGDYDSSKVNINFQDSDEAITVTVKPGYELVSVKLDVEDDNQSGYNTYPVVNGVKFNPSPGKDINGAKVVVKKLCEEVCIDPTATNYTPAVEGQSIGVEGKCEYPPVVVETPKVETPVVAETPVVETVTSEK